MKIPAIDISLNGKECYISVIKAKDLYNNSIVSRASDNGYQRLLSERRARNIAEYLDNGNIIPGCIIISANNKANLKFEDSFITFDEHKDSYFIIDGQHRLFGSHYSKSEDINISIYIFNNLTIEEEVQYFLDVNSKQKGVPQTLSIELTKFLTDPGTKDDIRLKLFNALNNNQDSILFNRLTSTTTVTGKISHVPFKEAIDPILESDIMASLSYEQKYTLLNNFFSAIDTILIDAFGTSKYLTTTVTFNALFHNFITICNFALMKGGYKIKNFIEIIEPIKEISFDEKKGTGKAANKALAEEMKILIEINNNTKNFNDLF